MKQILDWNRITNEITEMWIREYFDISEEEVDYFWVNDDVGEVFFFADYYISFTNVLDCYKHNVTKEQFLAWYYFCLENHSVNISLTKYILSPEEKSEAEKKHINELKQRVESAEKEFKEAIENYENRR